MLYLYHKEAGKPQLTLLGEEHRYIFKVRRHKNNDILYVRNLQDGLIHRYRIDAIDKKSVELALEESEVLEIRARRPLHIGWCIIDPKNIEKNITSLNEMGVEKITFIYCARSQKGFQVDFPRLQKILLNSSQQSGRSTMMVLDTAKDLKTFLTQNPQSYLLNFSDNMLDKKIPLDTIVVGCEGGFAEDEIALFSSEKIVGFDTPLILKSESAVCAVAGKILL
ncbi:MAG TPA: 16S rRNA (uracil(1498)-N(3))-methyltransferase [Sulfurovum sp. UBA12169]|nr:MAG TPA: 16S rRNA (uracil(1498)-N(3))-methyltransferase [Sulfurovum sp. UBA12169]